MKDHPLTSVVVPVKNSATTIRECVDSLLHQDYRGKVEIILVGDVGDTTWLAISDYIVAGVVTAITSRIRSPGRDANMKRAIGLSAATGDVLALTDSDMVLPPYWIDRGVSLLQGGWQCVGGSMRSVDRGLWSEYVDLNPIGSKTPRMNPSYVVTRKNFGWGCHKPPTTASVFLTRRLLDAVGSFDQSFVYSYEDYEFFQRVADYGCAMLCTEELLGFHHHRSGFAQLTRDYLRCGRGCADFMRKHPRSLLALKRMTQIGLVGLAPVLALVILLAMPYGWTAGIAGICGLAGISAIRARRWSAIAYPAITLVLGGAFCCGLLRGLVARPDVWHRGVSAEPPQLLPRKSAA